MVTQEPFGGLVRRYRRAAELTQEALAERAGVSVRAIRDIEAGSKHRPRQDTVELLLDALSVPADVRAALANAAARHFDPEVSPLRVARSETLPLQPTSFIGRQTELQDIESLLRREDVRLLTLTGPGGAGKTRLALRAAEAVANCYPEGVVFVSLAPLTDPSLVPGTIAGRLSMDEAPGETILQALTGYLEGKRLLLVLDNFEHLLGAADTVSHLLSGSAELEILVTSRVLLHLAAEHVYPVPPLMLPDLDRLPEPDDLPRYDAIQLFVQRAEAVQPGFGAAHRDASAVAEICVRLDGLPLAIELAAARVKLFSPGTLLSRLSSRLGMLTGGARDVPSRQQTLRKTIDWSYALLTPDEQRLFARLSIFEGGSAFEMIEAVCDPAGEIDVLAGTTALLEHSLLRAEGVAQPRISMLETIREYALERLEAGGEAPLWHRRHAEAYLHLAEAAHAEQSGPDRATWLERLEWEHNNLRAALSWCLQHEHQPEMALSLTGALAWFWLGHRHYSEGGRWLEQALALPPAPSDESGYRFALALAQTGITQIASEHHDFAAALRHGKRAIDLWRVLGDRRGLAAALFAVAPAVAGHQDLASARAAYSEGVELTRGLDTIRETIWGLDALGHVEMQLGDLGAAHTRFTEALNLAYRTGEAERIVHAQLSLAEVDLASGERAAARTWLDTAIEHGQGIDDGDRRVWALDRLALQAARQGAYDLAASLGDEALVVARTRSSTVEGWWSLGWALNHRGDTARCQGDSGRALELYGESLAVFREHRHREGIAAVLHNQGLLALQAGNTADARRLFTQSLALFRDLGFDGSVIACLAGLAGVVGREEQPELAATLFAAARAAFQRWDASSHWSKPANKLAWDREIAAARSRVDTETWERAWAAGQVLPLDDALARAELALSHGL